MTEHTVGKLLAVILALVFPLSMFAADTSGAMVYATNGITINGVTVQRSGAVLVGDSVQVPTQSAAAITSPGNQVVLAAGSTVTYAAQSIALKDGSGTTVTTTKGLTVKVGRVTVKPAARNTTKYEVARAGGEVLISTLKGTVEVYDGTSTLTVEEGKTATVADSDSQQPGAVPAKSLGSSKALAIIVLLGTAATATAIVLGTTGAPTVSPSRP